MKYKDAINPKLIESAITVYETLLGEVEHAYKRAEQDLETLRTKRHELRNKLNGFSHVLNVYHAYCVDKNEGGSDEF